jgi:hypothetical protein
VVDLQVVELPEHALNDLLYLVPLLILVLHERTHEVDHTMSVLVHSA